MLREAGESARVHACSLVSGGKREEGRTGFRGGGLFSYPPP